MEFCYIHINIIYIFLIKGKRQMNGSIYDGEFNKGSFIKGTLTCDGTIYNGLFNKDQMIQGNIKFSLGKIHKN